MQCVRTHLMSVPYNRVLLSRHQPKRARSQCQTITLVTVGPLIFANPTMSISKGHHNSKPMGLLRRVYGYFYVLGLRSEGVEEPSFGHKKRTGRVILRAVTLSLAIALITLNNSQFGLFPMQSMLRENGQSDSVPLLLEKVQSDSVQSGQNLNCSDGNQNGSQSNFTWADVDFSVQASCGVDKCFWPSISNPTTGYLITDSGSCKNFMVLTKAILFAQKIEQKCGARHLFAPNSSAISIVVPREILQRLVQNVHNPSRVAVGKPSPKVFDDSTMAVSVLKVVRAPAESILYGSKHGTAGTKWEAMMTQMDSFREKLEAPLPDIRQRLQEEKKRLECVLKEDGGCYWGDLQGLIDTQGRYYHIDLDQHFYSEKKSWCFKKSMERGQRSVGEFQHMIDILTQSQGTVEDKLIP